MEGWITLHRRLENHWIWKNDKYLKGWLYCLFRANFKNTRVLVGTKLMDVDRGSFITSRSKFGEAVGMSEQEVRTFWKLLATDRMINRRSTKNLTILTVLKYDSYQTEQPSGNQQLTNRQPTGNQQLTTENNDNNENNEKNDNKKRVSSVDRSLDFYRKEYQGAYGDYASKYRHFISYLLNLPGHENPTGARGDHILKLETQINYEQFAKLSQFCHPRNITPLGLLDSWLNNTSYSKGKKSVYATLRNWAGREPVKQTNISKRENQPLIKTNIGKEK